LLKQINSILLVLMQKWSS